MKPCTCEAILKSHNGGRARLQFQRTHPLADTWGVWVVLDGGRVFVQRLEGGLFPVPENADTFRQLVRSKLYKLTRGIA